MFNSEWNPYDELMKNSNNIQQCVIAINTGSELMKELGHKYAHQQEVIQQLMFQNKKLQQMLETLKIELVNQRTEIELLKIIKEQ
jgi:methanogenic corrinoid protein MtbC1